MNIIHFDTNHLEDEVERQPMNMKLQRYSFCAPGLWVMLRFLVASFFVFFLTANFMVAEAADLSFTGQCPLLFAQADAFEQTCMASALEYKTYFNGDPEVHYAYIGPSAPGSHFALGCTLDAEHHIDYLGVYYTIDSKNYKYADKLPFAYVDANGNSGIVVNSIPINFVFVRQFGDNKVPLHFKTDVIKNCDTDVVGSKNISSGDKVKADVIPGAYGGWFSVEKEIRDKELWIRACFGDACLPSAEYIEFYHSSDQKIIYTDNFFNFFVESDGGLLINKNLLNKACPIYEAAEKLKKSIPGGSINVSREVCIEQNAKIIVSNSHEE